MKTKLKITILLVSAITTLLLAGPTVLATTDPLLQSGTKGDLDLQDSAFIDAAGFGTEMSVGQIVSYVIKIFLSLLGVIFIILIIYAGFMWMTAAGSEEKISLAKKIMGSAIIGLAIVLAAYIITYFVIDKLLEATEVSRTGLDAAR